MQTRSRSLSGLCRLSVTFLALCLIACSSHAGETGVLKLKVQYCLTIQWITNARVDVEVARPGGGTIATATGYTNGSGYVEFSFNNLEAKDVAHVTVTPSGQNPDSNHTYYWVPSDGLDGHWDVGTDLDSICADGWYDESSDIILCRY